MDKAYVKLSCQGDHKMLEKFCAKGLVSSVSSRLVEVFREQWELSEIDALLDSNIVSETSAAEALGELMGIRKIDEIAPSQTDLDALRLIDFSMARRARCFPLSIQSLPGSLRRGLTLVIVDPNSLSEVCQHLQGLQVDIELLVGERFEVCRAIDLYYPAVLQIRGGFGKTD